MSPIRILEKILIAAFLLLTGCENEDQDRQDPIASGQPQQIVEVPPLDDSLTGHFMLIESDQTGPARVRIRQWLEKHASDSRGEFLMGLSYHKEKRYGRALKWFNQSILHQPVYPPAWHFLGWAHYYLGNPVDSRRAFKRHLQLDPTEGDSHFAMGLLAIEDWQLDKAEYHLIRAIDLQSSRPDRVKGISKAKARLSEVIEHRDGDIPKATTLLKESVELYPDHYEAWYRLARIFGKQGHEAKARHAMEQFHLARERVRP